MADFCDIGSDRAQQIIDDILAEAKRQAAARPKIDHAFCLDCDEAIPLRRREFLPGVETCIACQSERERRHV